MNYTCINNNNYYEEEEFNKILENHNKHKKMRKSKFNNLCNNLRKYNNNKNQNNIIDLFNDYIPMYNHINKKVFECEDNELLDLDLQTCTCGKSDLGHYNIIRNKHNNKKLVIGDSCIEFWITNKLIKNKISTIIYNQKNKEKGILKKRCICCNKKYLKLNNIEEFHNKQLCLLCEKKNIRDNIYKNYMNDKIKTFTINFGKYKGQYFEDLPLNYVKWLVEKEVYLNSTKDEYKDINKNIHNYLQNRINDNNNDT
jgi:hypothetical protein